VWIVDATNIRTGGMSNYVYGMSGERDVRPIPGEARVDRVESEEERERGYHGESRSGGLLHPWQGNEFDEMA
jgi:hypothetical protein